MQFALVLLASAASFRTVFALPAVEAVEAAEHVEMTEAANLDPLMGSKETDRTLSPVDEMNWRKRPFPWDENIVWKEEWQYRVEEDWYRATTPTVPSNLAIPPLLLPTKDRNLIELYTLAIAEADVHKFKSRNLTQNSIDLAEKFKDVWWFWHASVCMHNNGNALCKVASKAPQLSNNMKKAFEERFTKLKDAMKIEGLIQLGRRVQTRLAFSGCSLEKMIFNGCEGY